MLERVVRNDCVRIQEVKEPEGVFDWRNEKYPGNWNKYKGLRLGDYVVPKGLSEYGSKKLDEVPDAWLIRFFQTSQSMIGPYSYSPLWYAAVLANLANR